MVRRIHDRRAASRAGMGAALFGGVLTRLDVADRSAGLRRSRSGVPRLGGQRGKKAGHDRRASHRDGVDLPFLAGAQSHRYAEPGRAARAATRSLAQGSPAAALTLVVADPWRNYWLVC